MSEKARYSARRLDEVLERQGRKKRWLAAKVGVHESMICHLTSGRKPATEELANRISDALDMPLFLLFDLHERSKNDRTAENGVAA